MFEADHTELTDDLCSHAPIAQQLTKEAFDATESQAGPDVEYLADTVLFGTDVFADDFEALQDGRSPEFEGK